MAAQWRGKDGDLNAGNSDFLCSNTPDEFPLCRGDVEMDPQSCMDHSILAIFEDSAVTSEDKSRVEEENESLLSALTEMLDSVEDDDGTLSPFDTLPDTKLLTHQECRDKSAEVHLADRLRPRSKPPNVTFTMKTDGEKEEESRVEKNSLSQALKQQSQTLFQPNNRKVENEVEVFTSTSLVNLVKLMHPYCLKLHVEEGGKSWERTARPSASSWDKVKKKHTLFSQGEVLKYDRATEDSDEEINVVSDDEAPAKETNEEEEGDENRDDGALLKSILLNGNSSRTPSCREKKRVSFGPVELASFDESMGKELNEKDQTNGRPVSEALENPAGSAPEAQTDPSSEINSNSEAEGLPPKVETKAKSLSLQQYRQLRQKRQPAVEKQGNYTTKWPSVSEPPKELTPFLCLHGQRQNGRRLKTARLHPDSTRVSTDPLHKPSSHHIAPPSRPNPVEDRPSSHIHRSGSLCPKTESKIISPASPLPDVEANANVNMPESKKCPVKKPTLLSSDPPNPVLLPVPVTQTASPTTAHYSTETKVELLNRDSSLEATPHLQETPNESTTLPSQTQPSSSELKPKVSSPKQDRNLDSTSLLQEIKNKLSEIVSDISGTSPALRINTTQTESNSERKEPQSQKYSLIPTQDIKLEPKIHQSLCPDPVGQITCPFTSTYSSQPTTSLNSPKPVKETSPEVPSSISPPEELPPEQSAVGESGIEAPDLTSLLEQFEETEDKEEGECKSEPEPKLSTASPANLQTQDLQRTQPRRTEKTFKQLPPPPIEPLKPLSTSDSPGTPKTIRNLPGFQMLELADIPEPLGTEIILSTQQAQPARRKNPPPKAIQIIDPRPLPSKKANTSAAEFPAANTAAHLYSSVSSDHDYCVPADHSPTSATQHSRAKPSLLKDTSKATNEVQVTSHESITSAGYRKQSSIRDDNATVRAVNNSATSGMQPLAENHHTRSESNPSTDEALSFSDSAESEQDCGGTGEDKTAPCPLPTPPPSPPGRGREKRRYRRSSPRSSSSSSSSSASRSPKRPRLHHKLSESSSWSSSSSRSVSRSPPRRYRLSRSRSSRSRSRCSRSRSRSWSRSRSPSRSPSPQSCRTRWRDVYSSRESRQLRREHEIRIQKLKAIDERRVVYVGRIRRTMTHDELRERFSQFGDVECVSLHFRDRGDHYGFVTFYNMEDAFAAIDNGGKLRKPDELPFDICFGGRRQFCKSNYADLDANRDAEASPVRNRFKDLDFDSLLKQAQSGLKR
ncbi:peroxisome proliferator-activated receptor gamma coactivator-related protein 1-like [Scomber scombrus]|uniref:peroxisome proliferator-activated receptor gamma coactivator-related protein 1-like n=1 Tax=Scomber scombrus TaxID=13677 RepID=UPI002DD91618|nr:peroxisome proliferator-activated receptor gamma coactivator-related protein 1-like [Scomber scombrus]